MASTLFAMQTSANQPATVNPRRGSWLPPLQTAWLAALALGLLWGYWPTLLTMADRWSHDPQYSHGFLVPLFAGLLLWHRRDMRPAQLASNLGGLALLVAAVTVRLLGALKGFEPLDAFSFVPAVAGVVLLAGGWATFRWSWPAIAFLGFMLPLPFTVETLLAQPLKRLATLASAYCLQTLGLPAVAEGNVIYIEEVELGVLDACNGLGMLMTFFALSTAVAVLIQRRLLDKWTIVASAVPIAVIANVARISATGLVHVEWGAAAGAFMHDWAGWIMMPLALVLLWLEVKYLNRLWITVPPAAPLALDFSGAGQALPYPRQENHPLPCATRAPPGSPRDKPLEPGRTSR